MQEHDPDSAWLCLRRDTVDRLNRYKAHSGVPGWDEALIPSARGLRRSCGDREQTAVSQSTLDRLVAATLYEGYILYPYRPSSVKNQVRWTFGGVHPRAWSERQAVPILGPRRPNACCARQRLLPSACASGFCNCVENRGEARSPALALDADAVGRLEDVENCGWRASTSWLGGSDRGRHRLRQSHGRLTGRARGGCGEDVPGA